MLRISRNAVELTRIVNLSGRAARFGQCPFSSKPEKQIPEVVQARDKEIRIKITEQSIKSAGGFYANLVYKGRKVRISTFMLTSGF